MQETKVAIMTDWNPEIPNQQVRLRRNPGKRGVTTGQTKTSTGRLLVFVNFGPNEKTFTPYDQLEPCGQPEEIRDLLETGRYGNTDDLRRILTFEKVKGHLTNVFYSMESSNTDFYAYQFKPVLKFLDSPVGRLLIADEVGLGKTIEAMYIWKELQAREDARRLLIVCPAMLRDKWVGDIKARFNLDAKIIDAKELVEEIQSFLRNRNNNPPIYVVSLEGLRLKKWTEDVKGTKAELARLLEANQANDEFSIFDLVIIDEAHYLRNPETANNKLGELLRDASRHLLLLTATPIQIRSTNLYQLLKLISPEDFSEQSNFEIMLEANKLVVEALRLIWRTPPDLNATREAVEQATQSYYFSNSSRLRKVREELVHTNNLKPEIQVRLGQLLESSSLFGQFMTRSRKREVMKDKVKRSPQTKDVYFTLQEKQVYDYITYQIRLKAQGQQGIDVFRLIARQRQMTSCMVAALEAWRQNGTLKDYLSNEDDEELLWEIFGSQLENNLNNPASGQSRKVIADVLQSPFPENDVELDKFINALKSNDTKYNELIKFLKQELQNNKQEKFVLFAYFRDTLTYLQKRLEEDGISTCLMIGGMTREEKQETLEVFKTNNTRSVLLSSEVGSEGIDMQFCRFIINYDLPWNPMRVEQRIGRLDRLGQKANRISIINFSLRDTIEEYIIEKLYKRIKIFEESIGDLEEILGERTENLIIDLLQPNLTKEELKLQAEQSIKAIANEIEQQRKLENEAMNLVAFSDYILSTIDKSREQGRWLRPEELKAFVEDFFRLQYPGTVITPNRSQNGLFEIKLSEEAKINLKLFCNQRRFSTPTRLYSQTVSCFFEPKIFGTMGKLNHELLDPTHPLIQWIRDKYEPESPYEEGAQTFQPVSASRLNSQGAGVEPGVYVYVIHRWELSGLRTEKRLAYKVIKLANKEILPDEKAEYFVNQTTLHGEPRPNAVNLVAFEEVLSTYDQCEELLQEAFIEEYVNFEAENEDRCNVQERSARAYAKRKLQEYQERIERFRNEGKLTIIPAIEGQIKKTNQDQNIALKNIEQKRKLITSNPALAAGLIFVE